MDLTRQIADIASDADLAACLEEAATSLTDTTETLRNAIADGDLHQTRVMRESKALRDLALDLVKLANEVARMHRESRDQRASVENSKPVAGQTAAAESHAWSEAAMYAKLRGGVL
jgi:hypothetical protein